MSVFVFEVDFAFDKDTLKAGRVDEGTARVVIDATTEVEAGLLAEQMVAARGYEPTKLRRVAASIESPDEGSVLMYHGTTANAAAAIRRGGFAPQDLRALCRQIEDEFDIPRGKVWRHPVNAWAKTRAKEKTLDRLYVTIDRQVAERYAQAGSAPLYDFLKAAYLILNPDKVERSMFGSYVVGLDPWIRDQVIQRGGGPVLITFDVPESVIRSSTDISSTGLADADWVRIKTRLQVADRFRLDGISWPSSASLVRYVERIEPLEPAKRIITQNGVKTAAVPIDQVVYIAEDAMERSGQAGRRWTIKSGNPDKDPQAKADQDRLVAYCTQAARSMGHSDQVRAYASDYILDTDAGPNVDGMVNALGSIVVRPNTSDLILLHEVAHLVTRTREGAGGHGREFCEAARDLYARYISPAAAETFWGVVEMSLDRTATKTVPDFIGTPEYRQVAAAVRDWQNGDITADDVTRIALEAAGGDEELARAYMAEAVEWWKGLRWFKDRNGAPITRKASKQTIFDALEGLNLPSCAVDGDCLPISGAVHMRLQERGFDAHVVHVTGWVDQSAKVMGWMHVVVQCGEMIVDATATQYDRSLPSLIVANVLDYAEMMKRATRVESVTIGNFGTVGALKTRYTDWGERGNRTHITREDEGTIPTSLIANMPGVMGEVPGQHRNKKGQVWEDFKVDIRENGILNPIFITVNPGEKPKISEGNHRRDAAVELGMPEVPVTIRYFGKAEDDGLLGTTAAKDRRSELEAWINMSAHDYAAYRFAEDERAGDVHQSKAHYLLDYEQNFERWVAELEGLSTTATRIQYLHGSPAKLPIGTILVPDGGPSPSQSKPEHRKYVWLTDDPIRAEEHGWGFQSVKPTIYIVEPIGEVHLSTEHKMHPVYYCNSARIIGIYGQKTAMPSWRALSYEQPWWEDFDAIIATDTSGSKRNFEVYTYGELIGIRQKLADAKVLVEEVYGPLKWRQERMPREVAIHYYFGATDEFSDPRTAWVVDRLPSLGVTSAHGSRGRGRSSDDRSPGGGTPCGDASGAPRGGRRSVRGLGGDQARVGARNTPYTVFVKPKARADYYKLSTDNKRAVLKAVEGLWWDAFPPGAKSLTGPLSGYFHVSAQGKSLRVIYQVSGTHIDVVMVSEREGLYERARRRLTKRATGLYGDRSNPTHYLLWRGMGVSLSSEGRAALKRYRNLYKAYQKEQKELYRSRTPGPKTETITWADIEQARKDLGRRVIADLGNLGEHWTESKQTAERFMQQNSGGGRLPVLIKAWVKRGDENSSFDPGPFWDEGEINLAPGTRVEIESISLVNESVSLHDTRIDSPLTVTANKTAVMNLGPAPDLDYNQRVTNRLAIIEGSGYAPGVEGAEERMKKAYEAWRAQNKGARTPDRYKDPSRWVPAGYTYFTPFNSAPGTVAFVDLYASDRLVRIAYLAVRPDKGGSGYARQLVEEIYRRWPNAEVDWGKLMQPEMGHLHEDFKRRFPDRTSGGSRFY